MSKSTVWSTGYKPVAEDLKGLYHHTFETAGGLVIQCYLDYEAEERCTYSEPGITANIELVWALVEGVDISEILDDLKLTIEQEAMEDMYAAADDAMADAAADRREDARVMEC